jgi:hypothetical protein
MTETITLTVTETFPRYARVVWTARQGRTTVACVTDDMEHGSFNSDVLRQAVARALGLDISRTHELIRYERKRSDGAAIVPRLMHVTVAS